MNFDFSDRLSEFANYLAANTQPQPITSSNLIMPPGDLQPLDASGLINLEPPQQPVIMVNNAGIIFKSFLIVQKYPSEMPVLMVHIFKNLSRIVFFYHIR